MGERDELEWVAHLGHELKWLTGELTGSPFVARHHGWTPRIDVIETEDLFLVRVELAGVKQEGVQVVYHPDRCSLTVKGERTDCLLSGDSASPHLLEIDYGAFSRDIELPPHPICVEAIRTQFKNGILAIVLPKLTQTRVTVVIEESITLTRG